MKRPWGVLVPLLFFACMPTVDKEESLTRTGGNRPPVIRGISIQPSPLILSGPFTAIVQAQDDDGDNINFRYRWFANGKLVAEYRKETVEPKLFKRGDQVTVEVIPSDGKCEGLPLVSRPMTVANTAPIVSSVSVTMEEPPSRRATAQADIMDPDGDSVTIVYRWYKGEELLKEGEMNSLDLSSLKTKDAVQVEIAAGDGLSAPTTVRSSAYSLSNSPPKFVSTPTSMSGTGQYSYQVQAQDPDDDAIVFSLETGPSGMTIDAQSGMLRWTPGGEAAGVQQVRVIAKDARGGFATQEFELSMSAPAKAS
jgi:hypothetical protein